jgi:hypothetical protein
MFKINLRILLLFLAVLFVSGCSASKDFKHDENKNKDKTKKKTIPIEYKNLSDGEIIIKVAKEEQKNEMYSKDVDSTYLYWLNNKLILLKNQSKCNIFALNTLSKAGFKCPGQNALTYDLMNKTLFGKILPIVDISSPEDIKKGDLLVWYGHVIIFDSLIKIDKDFYALSIWAGTRQPDDGNSVINNVAYGKYPLNGEFIVRRPIRND